MKRRKILLRFFIAAIVLSHSSGRAKVVERHTVTSDNSRVKAVVDLHDDHSLKYSIIHRGETVIRPSSLGIEFADGTDMSSGLRIVSVSQSRHDSKWEQPWGQFREMRDLFNEIRITVAKRDDPGRVLAIAFRAYDDGIGFRYEIPGDGEWREFVITNEKTEFALSGDYRCWSIPAYENNRYEYLHRDGASSGLRAVHTPLTMQTDRGTHLSIHEAALTDWASMALVNMGNGILECDLVPWSDGTKVRGKAPAVSPWRTITVSPDAAGLITSTMILNMNEPSRIDDTSWIEPGKYIGIWWGMHIGKYTWGSGEKHGATTENTIAHIDFAAEHGFKGVLVEGWNLGWDDDWWANGSSFQFTIPHPDFDIDRIARHCEKSGAYLIGHHETGADIDNYERQLDAAFEYYERHGVRAVKTGYVGHRTNEYEWHHGQYMVRHYRKVVEKAAEHRIMVIVHEPIKATGIRRTWPNMISREGARGQEYNAWSGDGGNPPDHTTILPFTRMLGGPFDFTPGIFDLFFTEAGRPNNRVNTTLAKQLALYVVIYSPMQMAADLPENYEGHPAFAFIKDVPADWETTVALHASIGEYVTIARKEREGERWFIGSITDEEGRRLEAPLSFLDENREYIAKIYADGRGADWKERPYIIDISSERVNSTTTLEIELAPGGGQAIAISPVSTSSE
jgi:alpha-glucosidase